MALSVGSSAADICQNEIGDTIFHIGEHVRWISFKAQFIGEESVGIIAIGGRRRQNQRITRKFRHFHDRYPPDESEWSHSRGKPTVNIFAVSKRRIREN